MGRNWAIVVGINHYENLQDLNFAKRDASVMATWFQSDDQQLGFQAAGVLDQCDLGRRLENWF